MFDLFNKKQMYDSAIAGKENTCIISMFLTSLISVLCLVMHVLCVHVLILLSGFFWWRQFGNPDAQV